MHFGLNWPFNRGCVHMVPPHSYRQMNRLTDGHAHRPGGPRHALTYAWSQPGDTYKHQITHSHTITHVAPRSCPWLHTHKPQTTSNHTHSHLRTVHTLTPDLGKTWGNRGKGRDECASGSSAGQSPSLAVPGSQQLLLQDQLTLTSLSPSLIPSRGFLVISGHC